MKTEMDLVLRQVNTQCPLLLFTPCQPAVISPLPAEMKGASSHFDRLIQGWGAGGGGGLGSGVGLGTL